MKFRMIRLTAQGTTPDLLTCLNMEEGDLIRLYGNILTVHMWIFVAKVCHGHLRELWKFVTKRVGKHDADIRTIVRGIPELMKPLAKPRREVGFRVEEPKVRYGLKLVSQR